MVTSWAKPGLEVPFSQVSAIEAKLGTSFKTRSWMVLEVLLGTCVSLAQRYTISEVIEPGNTIGSLKNTNPERSDHLSGVN